MYERNGVLLERKFREYLLPTLLTTIAVSLATVVDSIIVGNLLGETALSAVGLSGPVIYILNMVFLLFAVGGVTCASIAKGRREHERANRIFTLTFVAGLAAMLLLVAVFEAFMRPICQALAQGNEELADLTFAYLTPLVFVGPVMMLIMGMAQFVRIDGSPKMSALISLVANGVNLVLDYVLIRYLNMGIAGAAVSTVIGYVAGIFMLLPYLLSKNRTMRFTRVRLADFRELAATCRVGLPKALTQGMSFLRTLVLNALIVAALGASGMAAMTLCINAMMLANMFIGGTNDTLLPIVGTLYGEKDSAGIGFTVRTGFKVMIISVVLLMLVFLIVPGVVAGIFGVTSPEGAAVAESALRMYALCLPFYGVNLLLQNFYQTTGRENFASVIAILNGFALVVGFAALLSAVNGNIIWLTFVLSEASALLVILIYGKVIRKKEGVAGMLLLRKEDENEVSFDITIPAAVGDAAALSEQVIEFCRGVGADGTRAAQIGLAAEEMAVNIARYGGSERQIFIDVLVRLLDNKLILRLRDDGIFFDPTKYTPEEEDGLAIGGIEVVRRLAEKVEYSRQLGLNVTVITVPKSSRSK